MQKFLLKLKTRFSSQETKPDFITIVSGLPRSGTSLMMNMLEAGGMEIITDHVRSADIDNPGGYYEFEPVKNLYKADKSASDLSWLPGVRGKVVKVISTLLPYLPGNFRYRIIFMHRNMAEILASQKKMLINRGEDPEKISDEQMAMIFDKNLHQVEEWISSHPNVSRIDVNYNQLFHDPVPIIEQVNQFLGGNLETEKMAQVINPNLYRQRLAK